MNDLFHMDVKKKKEINMKIHKTGNDYLSD